MIALAQRLRPGPRGLGHSLLLLIAVTTASGTLLRRKLEPVVGPVLQQYAVLRKTTDAPAGGRSNRRISGS